MDARDGSPDPDQQFPPLRPPSLAVMKVQHDRARRISHEVEKSGEILFGSRAPDLRWARNSLLLQKLIEKWFDMYHIAKGWRDRCAASSLFGPCHRRANAFGYPTVGLAVYSGFGRSSERRRGGFTRQGEGCCRCSDPSKCVSSRYLTSKGQDWVCAPFGGRSMPTVWSCCCSWCLWRLYSSVERTVLRSSTPRGCADLDTTIPLACWFRAAWRRVDLSYQRVVESCKGSSSEITVGFGIDTRRYCLKSDWGNVR